MSIPGIQKNI